MRPALLALSGCKDSAGTFNSIPSACSFDEWVANNSVNEPGAWASKAETAIGRYTNFPSGFRAPSRRGEVCGVHLNQGKKSLHGVVFWVRQIPRHLERQV